MAPRALAKSGATQKVDDIYDFGSIKQHCSFLAEVAKLVDARDSKSRGGNTVSVRLRPSAPVISYRNDWHSLPDVASAKAGPVLKNPSPILEVFMSEQNCIFCKIIKKEIPAKVIKENEYVLVVEDIAPKAPVHYLILPKKHIININYLTDEDSEFVWHMFKMAQELAKDLTKGSEEGAPSFNLISNNGAHAGQSGFHMHLHFVAGKSIKDIAKTLE